MRESVYLLRCNPNLSTNVKLVCDSNYNLYLESYDANEQLSDTAYKKFAISPDSFISFLIAKYSADFKYISLRVLIIALKYLFQNTH